MSARGAPYIARESRVPGDMLIRFLSDDGTTTGNKTITGDYTVATGTPTRFYLENTLPRNDVFEIVSLNVVISDGNGAQAAEYGTLGAALANGFSIDIRDPDGNTVLDLMDGEPVTTNGDWVRHTYDVQLQDWGAGADYIAVHWEFSTTGAHIALPTGWQIGVSMTDNFTGLLEHTFMIHGHIDRF